MPLAHLNVGLGVYLVYSVARSPASLVVQVVALDKHTVVAEASNPHLSLVLCLQLNALSNVKPSSLAGVCPVDIG